MMSNNRQGGGKKPFYTDYFGISVSSLDRGVIDWFDSKILELDVDVETPPGDTIVEVKLQGDLLSNLLKLEVTPSGERRFYERRLSIQIAVAIVMKAQQIRVEEAKQLAADRRKKDLQAKSDAKKEK